LLPEMADPICPRCRGRTAWNPTPSSSWKVNHWRVCRACGYRSYYE
jgi:hypothetical protein